MKSRQNDFNRHTNFVALENNQHSKLNDDLTTTLFLFKLILYIYY